MARSGCCRAGGARCDAADQGTDQALSHRRSGAQGHRYRGAGRPGDGADRPVGRRQIHRDPLHQPAGRTDRRHHHAQRHRDRGLAQWRTAPHAPPHGDDLSGIRAGRAAVGDGKRTVRPARLCRLLAKLHAQVSAIRHRRGVPPLGARRPRPHGRQARR